MSRIDTLQILKSVALHLILCMYLTITPNYAQETVSGQKVKQVQIAETQWEVVFNHSLCTEQPNEWKQLFFIDGLNGNITDTPEGLNFKTGNDSFFHADHSVLWTKQLFKDGLRVSYDYRRDDTIDQDEVCILYLLAEGIGQSPFRKDIEKWTELRRIPYMYIYFWGMRLAHISYATRSVNGEPYIRCRTYPMETSKTVWSKLLIPPSYDDPGFFKPHKWYHIEVYKKEDKLTFHVKGERMDKTFSWKDEKLNQIKSGRIGFRQMQGRNSSYRNLCISQVKDK